MEDATMQKLWRLTNELTAQLVFNRTATIELKQQLTELKAKAAHSNLSITDVPNWENDPAVTSLRLENERLMEENNQLQDQVKEYERWMEFIMTKFRLQNFAMTQNRREAMTEYYKAADQERELTHRLQAENELLHLKLAEVSQVARRAMDEDFYKTETLIETLEIENQGLREMLGVAEDMDYSALLRQGGQRISFPSTGSYVGSSGSDREGGPPSKAKQATAIANNTRPTHVLAEEPETSSPTSSNTLSPVDKDAPPAYTTSSHALHAPQEKTEPSSVTVVAAEALDSAPAPAAAPVTPIVNQEVKDTKATVTKSTPASSAATIAPAATPSTKAAPISINTKVGYNTNNGTTTTNSQGTNNKRKGNRRQSNK